MSVCSSACTWSARLHRPGTPLAIETVPVPQPGAGELLLEVAACGLCGTDIHLAVDGDIPVARTPITLGHEAAGTIVQLGAGVASFAVGQRVALFPSPICGQCRFCRAGRESLCEATQAYGMSHDGALARYIVALAAGAIAIPDAVDFATARRSSPTACRRRCCTRCARVRALRAGEAVAVVGCGGLGAHAILLARMMGAGFIAAIDTQPQARACARLRRRPRDRSRRAAQPGRAIRAALGRGVDLALEFVGRPETVEATLRCLDTGGRAVLVGVGPARPALPPLLAFVGREHSVIGSFGMDKRDIADLLQLVARGRLDLSRSVTRSFALAEVNEALGQLAKKDTGVVRLVVELSR
ncbi:MAG: alcohol dehydrogenase catalytic domain-containing protein [Ideonella sp.]|nr:alcohol dehydrogenase catalytic domain-containing protein [Ideonella sp.]